MKRRTRRRRRTYPVTPPMAPNPTERAETRALFHWPVFFCLVSSWSVCEKIAEETGGEKEEIPRTLFACHVKIQGPFAVEGIAAKNTPKYLTPTFSTKPMRQRPNTYFHTRLASLFMGVRNPQTERKKKGGKRKTYQPPQRHNSPK